MHHNQIATDMTPELQGAEKAVGRLIEIMGTYGPKVEIDTMPRSGLPVADIRALLASHATLTAENEKLEARNVEIENAYIQERADNYNLTQENEKLRGKVGELEHRLEIDRHYVLRGDKLVQETVPPAERADVPDGITCRDESIKILDGNIERLRARAEAAEAQLATAWEEGRRVGWNEEHERQRGYKPKDYPNPYEKETGT